MSMISQSIRSFSSIARGAVKSDAKKVFVVGVGMTKFEKPGSRENWDYPLMVKEAGTKALQDSGVSYEAIEQATVGYVFGESTCGNRAMYELGMTGIPISNVNNNCATGSTALFLARQSIQAGAHCVMAVGFEKMFKGSLPLGAQNDRESPVLPHMKRTATLHGKPGPKEPMAPWLFAKAGEEHMQKYGTTKEHFMQIAYKNHKHSVNNPYAQFQTEYTMDQIAGSPHVSGPLTRLQCSPTSDGAAAAVLCSEEFVKMHKLEDKAVQISGQAMATDGAKAFSGSAIDVVGVGMAHKAAHDAMHQAGVKISDVNVIELHDCFSTNELLTYEALGLCGTGGAGKLIDEGNVTYGGKWVVNPSGGLISKGHPLGATGLAQCAELCWQLRGQADKRQVKNAHVALQHNLGLGGAVVVTVYTKH